MNVKSISRTVGLILLITGIFSAFSAAHRRHRSRAEKYTRLHRVAVSHSARRQCAFCCSAAAATACSPRRRALPQRVFRGFSCSAFGALPFFLSGQIPSYVDAFFEMVSGFTTTGASILTDVEALSRCNLFWRSFSHWLGGMGVLVFLLAVVPGARKKRRHRHLPHCVRKAPGRASIN